MRQERTISGVEAVTFGGPGTLRVVQAETESLALTASHSVLPQLQSRVAGKVLHLGVARGPVTPIGLMRQTVTWDLGVRELQRLVMTGSGSIVLPDLDMDELVVELQGSGGIRFAHLTADRLLVKLSGSGAISLAGDVESQQVRITGSGSYEAMHLVSDYGSIAVAGSGTADVAVNDDLDVRIAGDGKVSYSGFPEITKQITGSGKLTRIRRPAAHRSS